MPKVSVIVPSYNHARFLERRVRSILDQTFQDFELIYLDDASPDNSNEVFAQFLNDPRVRAYYNETNSGNVFRQWNKGLGLAQGDYVWIAESDDCADPHFLETLVGKLDSHPSAGIAYCQTYQIDEDDNKLQIIEHHRGRLDPDKWRSDYFNSGIDECSHHLILSCTIINASSVLFRRSVAEKVGFVRGDWKVAGDYFFWANMMLAADVAFVAQPMNYLRTHVGSVSYNARRSGIIVKESYEVVKYIADHVDVPGDVLERARANRFFSWVCYNEDSPFTLAQHKTVYQAARLFDPHINRRILMYLPTFAPRYFGRPLKRRLMSLRANCADKGCSR